MAIYRIKNYGSGKYLNIHGTNIFSLSDNQNVTQWSADTSANEQKWVIDTIDTSSTSAGVPIQSYVDKDYSLNIYRTTKNCDVFPSDENGGGDGLVYFTKVSGVTNGYYIITKSDFSTDTYYLSLATNNATNGTNVCWAKTNGTNYQVWILEKDTTSPDYIKANTWLKLFKSPTSPKIGRDVNMPTVTSFTGSDGYTYSFTRDTYWYSYENPYTSSTNYINKYAYNRIYELTGSYPEVYTGLDGEYVDGNGNYWMAVGPNVVNPTHQSDEDITPAEMYGLGKLDVVVKDSNGTRYYIPAVVGDAKAHTWSNGIVQTFKSYPNGELTSAGSNFNGLVCAEFIGALSGKLTGLGNYSIEKIIFYAD